MKTYPTSWHSIKCFDNNCVLFSVWGLLKPAHDIVKGLTNINCDEIKGAHHKWKEMHIDDTSEDEIMYS